MALRYLHEPRSGIAAARNAGVDAAKGDWSVFIDDDNLAHRGCVQALLDVARSGPFDAVFGRVAAVFDGQKPRHWRALEQSLTRNLNAPQGAVPPKLVATLGAGNSLSRAADLRRLRFDDQFGLSGGEDSDLIRRLLREGRYLGWSPDARVDELVPASRNDLQFLLRRRFSSGQLRTHMEVGAAESATATAARWMALGAAQTVVAAGRGLASSLRGGDATGGHLADAAAGLGKIFGAKKATRYGSSQ